MIDEYRNQGICGLFVDILHLKALNLHQLSKKIDESIKNIPLEE